LAVAISRLGTDYLFLISISFIVLIVVGLAGFYLKIEHLQALFIIYGLMLLTPLFLIAHPAEEEKRTLLGIAYGVPILFTISIISVMLTRQFKIMGVFSVAEWPLKEAAKYPLTVQLGELAFTLGVTPQLLLSLLINIPGPVAEESAFRVFLLNTLAPVMGKLLGVAAQAVAFGVIHYWAYATSPIGIITASIAGLALGLLYLHTRSEAAISLSHMIYNMGVVLMGG